VTANAAASQTAALTWTAPSTGSFNVEVSGSASGAVGEYDLVITGDDDHGDNAHNAPTLVTTQPKAGDIERVGDVDWFSLDTAAGLVFRVDVGLGTLAAARVR